jgi:tetratricopeptide (TPR) repeat protein
MERREIPFAGKAKRCQSRGLVAALLVLSVISLAPTPAQADTGFFERRSISFAKRAFQDSLYDVSKLKLEKFLEKYPESDFKIEALWLLAQSHYFLGETGAALKILSEASPADDHTLAAGFLFWQAEALAADNQLTKATETYRLFLKKYPADTLAANARLGLSKTLFRTRDTKEALLALDPLLGLEDSSPDKQATLLQQCRILIGTEKYAEALKILNTLSTEKLTGPILYESSFLEGEIYRLQKKPNEALIAYRRITSDSLAQPRSLLVRAWDASGIILSNQKKWAEASVAFEKAFRLALNNDQIQQSVQRYLEAQFQNQTLTKGAMEVRNFVNKNPETAVSGLYAIGKYYFLEKKYDAAISELDHLLHQYPDSEWSWPARLTMAEALLLKNQPAEALTALKDLAENSPRHDVKTRALTQIGEYEYQQGEFKKAARYFQQATATALQEEKEALLTRSLLTLAQAGELDAFLEAEKSFFEAYPSSTHRVDLLMEKARLFEESGKDQQARQLYSELIQNQYNPSQTAEALFRLGVSGYESGKLSDALTAFTALETEYKTFDLLDQAGFLKIQCENMLNAKSAEDIVEELTQWLKRFPDSALRPQVRNYMGAILKTRGLYAEAIAQYRKVIELFPNTEQADEAAYWGGNSLALMTRFEEAIKMLEQVRPESATWKPNARLQQIVCYMRIGDYRSGLKVSESVLKNNPAPNIRSYARLRQAECLFTLASEDRKLYAEALKAVDDIINMESASSAERNEAGFIKGEIFKKSGEALQAYMDVVYGQLLPEESTRMESQPEFHWFIKSGLAAANIKETQGDIRGAVEIYRILERIGEPSRNEFRRKIEDLKNEYFLYEST